MCASILNSRLVNNHSIVVFLLNNIWSFILICHKSLQHLCDGVFADMVNAFFSVIYVLQLLLVLDVEAQ